MTRKAWDPNEKRGYGKHEYHQIDPDTINPADYARDLSGLERYGDVREYETADNSKHPENNLDLDAASRIGTEFETDAQICPDPTLKHWRVVGLPTMVSGGICIPCQTLDIDEEGLPIALIPAVVLGIVAGPDNLYQQVRTVLTKKVSVNFETRERLTKKD